MQNKLGIENLKIALGNLVKSGVDVAVAVSDGLQGRDIIVVWDNWDELNQVYAVKDQAIAEFKDLDPQETMEVVEHLATEFDIPNDEVEDRIERGARWVARGYRLYLDVQDWALDAKPIFFPKRAAA